MYGAQCYINIFDAKCNSSGVLDPLTHIQIQPTAVIQPAVLPMSMWGAHA